MEENRKRYDDENGKEKGVAIKSGVGQRLARYLTGGVSPYHVVRQCVEDLSNRGFEELTMSGNCGKGAGTISIITALRCWLSRCRRGRRCWREGTG